MKLIAQLKPLPTPAQADALRRTLAGETYTEYGAFRRGEQADSKLLEGFSIRVMGY